MKTNLIVSALLVVGLGLVGGTMVVSAAPPHKCAVGTVLGECDLTLEATQDTTVNSIEAGVLALAPKLDAQSYVYQYDPDSDAFTWFQFPRQASDQAASVTQTSRVYQYDSDSAAFTWFQFPNSAATTTLLDNSTIIACDPMFLGDNGD